ncbi:unnamed protein product [Boreogadus saida]
MEARPDPDTPAQMRAAVARYLAANALKDKALSTEQQKTWAAREEKYRKEWEELGVWAVGVKVTTSLTTAAWEHTLKESEWATTRRANSKKVREKDSVDYRKKREKYSYALLNAYNATINMEARKREGRPTDLSRQEKMGPKDGADHVIKGRSGPGAIIGREADHPPGATDVTTSLTTAAWEHTLKESEWATTRRANSKKVREKDSVDYRKKREKYSYALLNAYNATINMEARKREGRPTDLSRQEKMGPKDGTDHVIKGRSGPGAIIGREADHPPGATDHQQQQQLQPGTQQQQLQPGNQQQHQQQLQPNTQSYPVQNQQQQHQQQLQPNTQSYPAQNQQQQHQQQLQPNTQSYPAQNQQQQHQQQLQPNTQSYPAQNQQQLQQQLQPNPQPNTQQNQQQQHQQQLQPNTQSYPAQNQQQQHQQQLQPNTQSYPAQNQQQQHQQQLQPNTQSYPVQNQQHQQQLQPNTQSYPAQNQQHQQQLQPNTQSYPAQNQQQQHQQQLQPNTQSYPAQNQQTEGRVAGTPHSPLQS